MFLFTLLLHIESRFFHKTILPIRNSVVEQKHICRWIVQETLPLSVLDIHFRGVVAELLTDGSEEAKKVTYLILMPSMLCKI
jgi:hypothetical protein